MGRSIVLVEGQSHLEESKIFGGVQRFRWRCNCTVQDAGWTQRLSSKDPWTTLEAFRQHWSSKHLIESVSRAINWVAIHQQIPWLMDGDVRDDDSRFWVAPSGKRPAVASDYYGDPNQTRVTFTNATVSFTPLEERKGMSRLSDIQARMRELEKEAARYARFPKTDEWPVGTVITYNWTPGVHDVAAGAEVYTYAVLKAKNGDWYWTGAQRNGKYTGMRGNYDVLVENLADDNVSDIRVATPEDFDPLFPELTDLMSVEDAAKVEAFLADPSTGEGDLAAGGYVPRVKGSEK